MSLKTRSRLDAIPRCEPSTLQPINRLFIATDLWLFVIYSLSFYNISFLPCSSRCDWSTSDFYQISMIDRIMCCTHWSAVAKSLVIRPESTGFKSRYLYWVWNRAFRGNGLWAYIYRASLTLFFIPIFLLVPASAPRLVVQRLWYVLSFLRDGAYKRTLAANR